MAPEACAASASAPPPMEDALARGVSGSAGKLPGQRVCMSVQVWGLAGLRPQIQQVQVPVWVTSQP